MKFDHDQAAAALHGLAVLLLLALLVSIFGYGIYIAPWPLKIILATIVATPIVGGLWPKRKNPPKGGL